ncbi:cilia- and flagella- associated protein 210-like [Anguilla rostrata]|uniref:cilia- and flagella- associated protein 210-like n=1 Tax=Anguilla rostrata TaxID=7938 RepID=UPI0030CC9D83
MTSFQGGQCGKNKAIMIRSREEAMANLAQQQFFDSDRVKQFHRQIMLSETLKERDHQVRQKQVIADHAKEENRKLMELLRCKEMEVMEQERQRAKQRELQRKSVADFVKQQLWEKELVKRQRKVDKEREINERRQIQEQYEKEVKTERQKQHEQKTNVRKTYTEQILAKKAMGAKEAKQKEMEEKRRRQIIMEKDNWNAMVRDIEADRQDGLQRRRDIVAEKLALKMQEDMNKKEQHAADVLATALAQQDSKWLQALNEKNEKRKAMMDAIAAHRENKRKQHEQNTTVEKQRAWCTLQTFREEDRLYWENEQKFAQRKREELRLLNEERHQQMTEKFANEKRKKEEQLEFDARNTQLIYEEDAQFQAYTAAVISAAAASEKNTYSLCRVARMGMGCGVGPITGGLRANYLVPGATYANIPDYTRSITQDVTRFSRAHDDLQSTKNRLGFA